MSSIAAIAKRQRVSRALFGATKWGNPFAEERFPWPYPMYDRMRADGEVAYGRAYHQRFVFGYDEVQQVLRSTDCVTAPIDDLMLSSRHCRKRTPSVRTSFSRWLLATDPPDHTRLRSAVARAFTTKQIHADEPMVRKLVDELLGLPADRRDWLQDASREVGGLVRALQRPRRTHDQRPLRRTRRLLPRPHRRASTTSGW